MSDDELTLEPLTDPAPTRNAGERGAGGQGASDEAGIDGARRSRTVARLQPGFITPEGAGARVSRTLGLPSLWNVSPFLILDYCDLEPGQGFPDHPHRGMATVTLVLDG